MLDIGTKVKTKRLTTSQRKQGVNVWSEDMKPFEGRVGKIISRDTYYGDNLYEVEFKNGITWWWLEGWLELRS